MRRPPIHLLTLLSLALLALACSDPEFPAAADGADAGSQQCGSADDDKWSCNELGDCAKQCGTNLECIEACKDRGCDEAQATFEKFSTCVQESCLTSCLEGFSETCYACATGKCPNENAECTAQACPQAANGDQCDAQGDDGEEKDDEEVEDELEPSPEPSGMMGCSAARACREDCFFGDCSECASELCASAANALETLDVCMGDECAFDCFLQGSGFCSECMATNCSEQLAACEEEAC